MVENEKKTVIKLGVLSFKTEIKRAHH